MSNRFEETALQKSPRAEWVKPAVRQLKAGAAEFGTGAANDDGDGNAARDNS